MQPIISSERKVANVVLDHRAAITGMKINLRNRIRQLRKKRTPIQLSDHFSYGRLLRFTWPSMMMLIITSVYGVVDGMMVSNFVGTTPFAALNLIWPFVMIMAAIGYMFSTGGSALVAKIMGEGDLNKSRDVFSMLTYCVIGISFIMGKIGHLVVRNVAELLGSEGIMTDMCEEYGGILLDMLPAFVLQIYFQSFLITAEKPKMGMWVTIGAGLINIALDWIFIKEWGWGLKGAAWATALSQSFGGLYPLIYFITDKAKESKLWLGKATLNIKAIIQTMSNGLSEFVMNISLSFVSMLYMYILLKETGENGVSAYGVIMYYIFIFVATFLGFGIGSAPIVSYHYGAQNKEEMHNLLKKGLTLMVICGIVITASAELLSYPLSYLMVGYDTALLTLTVHAFRIYSLNLLVTGINIYASAFFTALNNGPVSAFISLSRTLIFEAGSVLLLPLLFGIEGIWWSVIVAEVVSAMMSIGLLLHYQKKYGY